MKALAKIFDNELQSAKVSEESQKVYSRFRIELNDDTSYASSEIEVFDNQYAVDFKRVESILMYVRYYDKNEEENSIIISLSTSTYSNYFEVSGTNSHWVNGIATQISKCLGSLEKQNPLSIFSNQRYGILLLVTLFCVSIYSIWVATSLLASHSLIKFERIDSSYTFLSSMGISFAFLALIRYLYPTVELQIGPNHLLKEKVYRNILCLMSTSRVLKKSLVSRGVFRDNKAISI